MNERVPPYEFAIAACARWESRFIVEWLNYYRAIGFDHVFLYCNDDEPFELYEKVLPFTQGREPFVTFRFYPYQGQQTLMYCDFIEKDIDKCQWVSFFDIDEFLRLPDGITIKKFIENFPHDTDCVLFNWIFFGPSGHKDQPGQFILKEYKMREFHLHPFTKYIARSFIFMEMARRLRESTVDFPRLKGFWHNPSCELIKNFRALNPLGEDMTNYYDGFPEKCARFVNEPERKEKLLSTAAIHHYAFRTESAFIERVKRGLGGDFDGQGIWGEVAAGGNFEEYLAHFDTEDSSLTKFWPSYLEKARFTNVFSVANGKLVSKGKRATQSSVSQWSRFPEIEKDAGGAVGGQIDGSYGFHTDIEDEPWWQIDLEGEFRISEIRIFNRMDHRERASRLAIEIGNQVDQLHEVYRRESDLPFGGIDGHPLIFVPKIPILGRYVRIKLLRRNFLHFDQVEIYHEPPPLPEGFDPELYLVLNPDVHNAGADPICHWQDHGYRERRKYRQRRILARCTSIRHGGHRAYPGKPDIDEVCDVFCVPFSAEHPRDWGIFNADRRLISSTGYYRGDGNGRMLPIQEKFTTAELWTIKNEAPDDVYIYGGTLHAHYGHFLLGALSRFWMFNLEDRPKIKILTHEEMDLDRWFAIPHVAFCFNHLGLTKDDFVNFREPVRIQKLIVPHPSFIEDHSGYEAFAQMCNNIGREALAGIKIDAADDPIYLSKSKLTRGLGRFINEYELEEELEWRGVKILHPQEISLVDQIKLFIQNRIIVSTASSALHTSMFSWNRPKLIVISHLENISSNFTICDEINGNCGQYFYPDDGVEQLEADPEFAVNFRLTKPREVAEDILRLIDQRKDRRRQNLKPIASKWPNIALGKVATQSSVCQWSSSQDPKEDAVGAVNGVKSGRQGFHTDVEDEPWWMVDLGGSYNIHAIKLFNRLKSAPGVAERSARLAIDIGPKEQSLAEVYRREENESFGGIDGDPLIWAPMTPIAGRFVRIRLLTRNYLHLDEVEVYGEPLTTRTVLA